MLSHLRHELLHVVHARPLVLPPSAAIVTQFVTRLQARGQTDHLLVSEPEAASALLCANSGGPEPSLEVRPGSPLCGPEVPQLVARTPLRARSCGHVGWPLGSQGSAAQMAWRGSSLACKVRPNCRKLSVDWAIYTGPFRLDLGSSGFVVVRHGGQVRPPGGSRRGSVQ